MSTGDQGVPGDFAVRPRPGGCEVTAERELGGVRGTGRVAVAMAPGADGPPPHAALAAGRAWHSVASELLRRGQAEDAAQAVERGLDELGGDYAPPGTKDDTGMKGDAARGRLRESPGPAAASLLRVLDSRLALYADRWAGELGGEG